MILKYIMSVGFKMEKDGEQRIAGGLASDYSIDNLKGLYLEEKEIIIQSEGHEYRFKVKKSEIATSIIEQVNLGLSLYKSADFHKVKLGDKVHISIEHH
ncbi:hypothetical protein [Enterococcus sp. LJL51]|uniref:hypothetical protein n=1 Tax=Enterococcus sp. LJL51 TaxID=3416656 RepID=UPI003CFA2D7C